MAVSDARKYTKDYVIRLLDGVIGRTLGGVDFSHQFDRTSKGEKITGIAGDVIEQSVFGYARDNAQECDMMVDGTLTELKTTGVRVPKALLEQTKGKTGHAYNVLLSAKEGISITGVTFEPTVQTDFLTSHFWEKAEHLLIVFYEYKAYSAVPASAYADFPIVGYSFNSFSADEQAMLRSDWEIVSAYLQRIYVTFPDADKRNEQLVGFTHVLRSQLLLIELVPGFKRRPNGSYQKPRYRLKKTFVDHLVHAHFQEQHDREQALAHSFASFKELDARCHALSCRYGGKTVKEMMLEFGLGAVNKQVASVCVVHMFGASAKKLNLISDFAKAGIIAKTIHLNANGKRKEDMKLARIYFDEWADRDTDFEDSDIYRYFCEHSFLFPIFRQDEQGKPEKAVFLGFKRLGFDEHFLQTEVKRLWDDSRGLIHQNKLRWEYVYDKQGNKVVNKSGGYKGAPNFPKSSTHEVFMRGGGARSEDSDRTECVNHIRMLPQFFWIKGSFIVDSLQSIPFI